MPGLTASQYSCLVFSQWRHHQGEHLKFIENLISCCYWSTSVEPNSLGVGYVFLAWGPGSELQWLPTQLPIKEEISLTVKWTLNTRCLTFVLCVVSRRGMACFFFFVFLLPLPTDLAEAQRQGHGERMGKHLWNRKKRKTQKQISEKRRSKWMTGSVPSCIDLLYKALEWAR